MKPPAVLDLGLVGAGIVVVGAGDRHAFGDDRLGGRGDDVVIGAAGPDRVVREAVELLVLAVAHHQPVIPVPQHESLGDGLDRIAKSRILVGGTGRDLVVGDHGDAGEPRLPVLHPTRDVPAQSQAYPMSVGVTQAEATVEQGGAVAEMPVDRAAQIVLGMQSLRDGPERHGFVARLQAEQPVHRRRPMHMAAGEVPAPDAAAGQRLGQLLGQGPRVGARGGRREVPQAAREERKHQPGQDEERDFEPRGLPPSGERGADRLDESELRVGLRHVAHGDDGIGAVEQRQPQHAGIGPERGERLLRSQNGEEIARVRAFERRAGLDLALGVGEQDGTAVGGRAFGHARRQCALPIGARAEGLVLQAERGVIGNQRELPARRIEGGALAVDQL